MTQHKHYQLAYQAHYNMSHTPDRRAEMYCADFDADIAQLQALSVPQEKIDRFERLWCEWMRKKSRCMSSMITGPANFPVERNRRAMDAEHRAGQEVLDYFNKLVKRAKQEAYYEAHPEARPIASGDADAIKRLREKLAKQEEQHAAMKAHNVACRKSGEGQCVQPFELTNSNARIKATRDRIAQLERRKDQGEQELTIGGVRVVQNSDVMRLQLFFDGKPEPEMRALLKKHAFKWAPSVEAWQRQLTNNALYAFNTWIKPAL